MKRVGRKAGSPQVTVKGMQKSADALARKITSKTNQWKRHVKV